MTFRTRFAPSPTGPLHLGHAFSAMLAHDYARKAKDSAFLLRIDDIDQSRARSHWEYQIYDDLNWLGVTWDEPVRRQSEHFSEYADALQSLTAKGLTYPCRCSRRDIRDAASAPQEGALTFGPDGIIYPGTCRERPMSDAQPSDAIRLDMAKAIRSIATLPSYKDIGADFRGVHHLTKPRLLAEIGDPVLARPYMAASYHLSVVVDDAKQRVTHVIRGADLFEATALHVVLAALLGQNAPIYLHHALIRDANGKRLAKRDDDRAIATYRAEGLSPQDIRQLVGLSQQK